MTQDYIGTKRVTAWPEDRKVDLGDEHIPIPGIEYGYAVQYEDGYESWSPKAAFEAAYHPITAMPFEGALFALKAGHRVRRAAWGEQYAVVLVTRTGVLRMLFESEGALHGTMYNAIDADLLADDWMIVE
jgi:hypothetical protein